HGAKALVVPNNISLVPLPPRAPELNGQENIWQFMRQNWLSNRIFKSFDDIVDHCCYAWNTLIDQPCPSRDATAQSRRGMDFPRLIDEHVSGVAAVIDWGDRCRSHIRKTCVPA